MHWLVFVIHWIEKMHGETLKFGIFLFMVANVIVLLAFERTLSLWCFMNNFFSRHSNGRTFSCRGLQICIDYFLQRKHKVVAFVPQYRKSTFHSQDTAILDVLEKQGLVTFTPSRKIGRQLVVAYDDRWVDRLAAVYSIYVCMYIYVCVCLFNVHGTVHR